MLTTKKFFVLVIALLQGILYVFAVPPWWHYDEPGHFEFAWQIAHFDHWPQPGEYDNDFRRELASYMINNQFYEALPDDKFPDLEHDDPIFIGPAPQTTNYFLYYLVVSLPLRVMSGTNYDLQNYVLRLLSMLMFLLSLWLIWKTLIEIWPQSHPVPWITILFIALLPGFADTMTAINDDVGAVLTFSIFYYFAIRTLKEGFKWKTSIGLLIGALLAFWTKNTTWFSLPLLLLIPALLLLEKVSIKMRWGIIGLNLIAGLAFIIIYPILTPSAARAWYWNYRRIQTNTAPQGNYALTLVPGENAIQVIPPQQAKALRGQTITVGAWLWADTPTQAQIPVIRFYRHNGQIAHSPGARITLSATPTYYSQTWTVPDDVNIAYIILTAPSNNHTSIYYDDVFLGPATSDSTGKMPAQKNANLVRNPSFETFAWVLAPEIQQQINVLKPETLPGHGLSTWLMSMQDLRGSLWYYRRALSSLQQTFWAKPAGARIPLPAANTIYNLLQTLTFIGITGSMYYLWHKRTIIHWKIFFFFIATIVFSWGLVLIRTGIEFTHFSSTPPRARYIMPSILPVALTLTIGWKAWLDLLSHKLHRLKSVRFILMISFWLALDLYTIIAIALTFYLEVEFVYIAFFATLFWVFVTTAWLFKEIFSPGTFLPKKRL